MRFIGFALLGPLIPTSIIVLIFFNHIDSVMRIIYLGYIIGIVPSIIAAITYYFICKSKRSSIQQLPSFMKGSMSGSVTGGIIYLVIYINSSEAFIATTFFVCCLFSGAICGQIFRPRNQADDSDNLS